MLGVIEFSDFSSIWLLVFSSILFFGVSKNAPQNNKTDIDKAIATNTFLSIIFLSINLVLIGDKIKVRATT